MRAARIGLISILFAAAAGAEGPPLAPPQLEEAASVARHVANAVVNGRIQLLTEALDRDALISRAAGVNLAVLLTLQQRRRLESALIESIASSFERKPETSAEVKLLSSAPDGSAARVAILLPIEKGYLKTEWRLRQSRTVWRVEDIVLSDSGRSLREEAIDALGPAPIAILRDRSREVKQAARPRAAGLIAVVLVGALFLRRLEGADRRKLLFIAAVPALLFALDGTLSIARIWREPVELRLSTGSPRQAALYQFHEAVRRKDVRKAQDLAERAVREGVRPQPLHFVLGRLLEDAARPTEAAQFFQAALAPPRPAPGAWAGLARLSLLDGRYADAEEDWNRYFSLTPPDAASLYLLALAQGQRRDFSAAQKTVADALEIEPAEPRILDLAARLAAGAGDVSLTIVRLREEEKLAPIDRPALEKDSAFASLADKSEWLAFLAEKPP